MTMQLCETKTFLSFLVYFSQGLMGFHEELRVLDFVDAESSSKDIRKRKSFFGISFLQAFLEETCFFPSRCTGCEEE